jgi:acyl carrier protein
MSDHDLQTRLRDVFAETFAQPEFGMEPELKMGDIEVWDSFNHINLMLSIEAEFGVEFESDEIGTLLSVGQISDALHRRLDAPGR